MNKRFLAIGATVLAAVAGTASGQTYQRRATMVGGGNADYGKCTIEVVVDGAAEVEIRGDNAILRNIWGQPPQWRRFECTGALPADPTSFRFAGVDGRGSQELVRVPQRGSAAVIRIQDPNGGAEGYTFDITWGREDFGFPGNQSRGPGGRRGSRITTEEAVRGCQDAVRQQAFERYRARNVAFRRTALDDNPGRRDWVTGLFDIRRGYDRDETYRFSCSTNFDTGEIRSVEINPVDRYSNFPGRGRGPAARALETCEQAVDERIRQNGYQHVDILSIEVDNRPGRNDWVIGTARADIRFRSDTYEFSCSVNLQNGDTRSVQLRRR